MSAYGLFNKVVGLTKPDRFLKTCQV
jgi:hypothetical protein